MYKIHSKRKLLRILFHLHPEVEITSNKTLDIVPVNSNSIFSAPNFRTYFQFDQAQAMKNPSWVSNSRLPRPNIILQPHYQLPKHQQHPFTNTMPSHIFRAIRCVYIRKQAHLSSLNSTSPTPSIIPLYLSPFSLSPSRRARWLFEFAFHYDGSARRTNAASTKRDLRGLQRARARWAWAFIRPFGRFNYPISSHAHAVCVIAFVRAERERASAPR